MREKVAHFIAQLNHAAGYREVITYAKRISRSANKLKRTGRLKRKKWMTATHNVNRLCFLEQIEHSFLI